MTWTMAAALACLAAAMAVSGLQLMGWRVPPAVPLVLMIASAAVVVLALAGCAVPLR